MNGEWSAIEMTWDRQRKEWNLLVRRPFYLNLRLGLTQCALWIAGKTPNVPQAIFNVFPNLTGHAGR